LKITPITSNTNALLKTIRGLQQRSLREKTGLFLIEGRKAVAEALEKRLSVKDIVISQTYFEQDPDVVANHNVAEVSVVDDKMFKELTPTVTPEGILAVASTPHFSMDDIFPQRGEPLIVVAHAVQDPGNLGTIVRTALAASATGLILTRGTVDPFNPKVVRAAMGALFALPIVADIKYEDMVSGLKQRGVRIIACEGTATKRYFEADLTGPLAIVLGNEGQGFADVDLSTVDELVSIPMNPQSESLNVAVSGAIVLFSAVQQRLLSRK
jgi:TrmH family RNA methyltransferase